MKPLTLRQQEVLEFVQTTQQRSGSAPTLREIAAHFRFRSVKAAADHVTALRRKGVLAGEARRARSLRVVSPWNRSGGRWRTSHSTGPFPPGLPGNASRRPKAASRWTWLH
ncbi:MAG: hypothetical protein M5U12_09495 [Verrucomicrobia bacterium]|nr:hypothetical protein [Verrucomicrobiota bacterium]